MYAQALGPVLGAVFNELFQDLSRLHVKWGEFDALFGRSEQRVDLLNRASGSFFRVVQDCLWEDVLLHLARLTDPPMVSGRPTLSIQRLPPLITDLDCKSAVQELVRDALKKVDFARDWRHRHIAHRDLRLALEDQTAAPLLPASRLSVREALESIVAVMNRVESQRERPAGEPEAQLRITPPSGRPWRAAVISCRADQSAQARSSLSDNRKRQTGPQVRANQRP